MPAALGKWYILASCMNFSRLKFMELFCVREKGSINPSKMEGVVFKMKRHY